MLKVRRFARQQLMFQVQSKAPMSPQSFPPRSTLLSPAVNEKVFAISARSLNYNDDRRRLASRPTQSNSRCWDDSVQSFAKGVETINPTVSQNVIHNFSATENLPHLCSTIGGLGFRAGETFCRPGAAAKPAPGLCPAIIPDPTNISRCRNLLHRRPGIPVSEMLCRPAGRSCPGKGSGINLKPASQRNPGLVPLTPRPLFRRNPIQVCTVGYHPAPRQDEITQRTKRRCIGSPPD